MQRGGLARLAQPTFVPALVARMKACRDTLLPAWRRCRVCRSPCRMAAACTPSPRRGADDSLVFAKRLVAEAGLGLAPMPPFGPEAEGWLRWCFASRDPARLTDEVGRPARALRL